MGEDYKNELLLYQKLLDNSADMIFIIRLSDGFAHYISNAVQEKLGYTLEEIRELGIDHFRRPLNPHEKFAYHLKELEKKGSMTDYAVLICKNGDEFPIEANVKVINVDGEDYNLAIVRDITERVKYESEINELNQELQALLGKTSSELEENSSRLNSYRVAMDESSIVSVGDLYGKITYVNNNFCSISGYTREELMGKDHNIVRHPNTPTELFVDMWQTIKNKKIWRGQIENQKKDGSSYFIDAVIAPVLDVYGEVVEYISTRHDITELIAQKNEIQRLATTSFLTSLGNRNKLYSTIDKNKKASIAIIDIDRFHEINDFYGNTTGDKVIKLFAEELASLLGDKFELFHLQGDEFAILNTKETFSAFSQIMKEVNTTITNKPLTINEKTFFISTTVSISFEAPSKLISSASLAHTYAKQNKLNFVIFSPDTSLEHEYEENIQWALKIKNAINDDRIAVFFQPIVDVATQKISKYEALVRLIDEDGTVQSPAIFLEKAKKSKQYIEITKIVIEKTMQKLSECEHNFSINLTIEDILNKGLCEFLFHKLSNCKKPYNITFELVESESIEKYEQVTGFIKEIKGYGCSLAIDDFGTGYSNFEYLIKLNADIIKIDGSLIKLIDKSEDYYDIVQTIVHFAKIKKLRVVAEYVSSASIYEKIKALGIDYAQGYYFSPPRADLD